MENVKRMELTSGLLGLLTVGAAFSVSTLYYAQPMLGAIREDLGSSVEATSLIASMTQVGYATGLFFLAPLGDRYDRKGVITIKLIALTAALIFCFFSSGITALVTLSFFIGLFATAAQDYVPAVAILAPEESRGQKIGFVVTGILLGILLSRLASGAISEWYGWRAVFATGSVLIFTLLVMHVKFLPKFQPTTDLNYKHLLGSLFTLIKKHRKLRYASLAQALMYSAFSAFWSTLAIILHDRFHLGPMTAGLFGLAGAAGTLAAPIAGRLSDKLGAHRIARIGTIITTLSFGLLFFIDACPQPLRIPLMVVCAVGFDFGIQGSLVSHQTIIYALEADAKSRLNAVFVTGNFVGMAIGAVIGGFVYSRFGMIGFAIFVTGISASAILLKLLTDRRTFNVNPQYAVDGG